MINICIYNMFEYSFSLLRLTLSSLHAWLPVLASEELSCAQLLQTFPTIFHVRQWFRSIFVEVQHVQHANAKQVAGISRNRTTIGLRMFFLDFQHVLRCIACFRFYILWNIFHKKYGEQMVSESFAKRGHLASKFCLNPCEDLASFWWCDGFQAFAANISIWQVATLCRWRSDLPMPRWSPLWVGDGEFECEWVGPRPVGLGDVAGEKWSRVLHGGRSTE